MIPPTKIYSSDVSSYDQKSVRARIEALLLNNVGLVVTRAQIIAAARNPVTGAEPENWHQRLSELRTDKGYTILSSRDWSALKPEEYVLANTQRRAIANRRVRPTPATWRTVLTRANDACEWQEDGQACALRNGAIDPIGGGTVKLTPDHTTPHSVNPQSDPGDPTHWQALCGRHQVMKKNFWDGATGKINVIAILQAAGAEQKEEAYDFLKQYLGK
ncbi:hypothetical protein V3I01_06280 [Sphingomonas sp. gentR]|uniref:restriction endonuclease n=1 Tax=unclassified Sphingomonas TaxID=196159 RepID=UPI000972AB4B|nr:restriction endonuclease [Sphingomonas sp. LK11]APX65997.1 restriction endonuclease [Sphingomonas sp. LK11]